MLTGSRQDDEPERPSAAAPSRDGGIGRRPWHFFLERGFQRVLCRRGVVLTTSRVVTTGGDERPCCHDVVDTTAGAGGAPDEARDSPGNFSSGRDEPAGPRRDRQRLGSPLRSLQTATPAEARKGC